MKEQTLGRNSFEFKSGEPSKSFKSERREAALILVTKVEERKGQKGEAILFKETVTLQVKKYQRYRNLGDWEEGSRSWEAGKMNYF